MKTSVNIGKILKNALADVLSGKHYLIISAIETIESSIIKDNGKLGNLRKPRRVCYYITPDDDEPELLRVRSIVFASDYIKNERARYKLVRHWDISKKEIKDVFITAAESDDEYFNNVLKFFIEKNIDTVCTIDPVTEEPIELVYDHTGKAYIARQFIQNARKWSNIKTNAEREGDPSVFFDTPEQKELLEKMKNNPEKTLQNFGKRKPKRKNNELTKINSLIAQINKVLK